jgi:hypothetical protein
MLEKKKKDSSTNVEFCLEKTVLCKHSAWKKWETRFSNISEENGSFVNIQITDRQNVDIQIVDTNM